jgi:hypothetical protein
MSIQLKEENGGKLLIIFVSESFDKRDCEQFMSHIDQLSDRHPKVRVLFDMTIDTTDFSEWDMCNLWESAPHTVHHFANIDRLAIVREKTQQHRMAMFCKPFTRATIRYFNHDDAFMVRQWLDKN